MTPEDKVIAQAFLNKVVPALRKQGHQSRGESERDVNDFVCRYRGDNGDKCAIGHAIDDDFYDERMEGYNAVSPAVVYALEQSGFPLLGSAKSFYLEAQEYLHDQLDDENFATDFEQSLEDFCADYELEVPPKEQS